jgi:hypothetical protein
MIQEKNGTLPEKKKSAMAKTEKLLAYIKEQAEKA